MVDDTLSIWPLCYFPWSNLSENWQTHSLWDRKQVFDVKSNLLHICRNKMTCYKSSYTTNAKKYSYWNAVTIQPAGIRQIRLWTLLSRMIRDIFLISFLKKRREWAGVDHYPKDEGSMAWWRPAYYHWSEKRKSLVKSPKGSVVTQKPMSATEIKKKWLNDRVTWHRPSHRPPLRQQWNP